MSATVSLNDSQRCAMYVSYSILRTLGWYNVPELALRETPKLITYEKDHAILLLTFGYKNESPIFVVVEMLGGSGEWWLGNVFAIPRNNYSNYWTTAFELTNLNGNVVKITLGSNIEQLEMQQNVRNWICTQPKAFEKIEFPECPYCEHGLGRVGYAAPSLCSVGQYWYCYECCQVF